MSISFRENENVINKEKVTGGRKDVGEGVDELFCLEADEVEA